MIEMQTNIAKTIFQVDFDVLVAEIKYILFRIQSSWFDWSRIYNLLTKFICIGNVFWTLFCFNCELNSERRQVDELFSSNNNHNDNNNVFKQKMNFMNFKWALWSSKISEWRFFVRAAAVKNVILVQLN